VAGGGQGAPCQPRRGPRHPVSLPRHTDPYTMDEHDPGTGIARRHGLVESRMRGDTHVRFGGAGRGTRSSERAIPRPGPTPTRPALRAASGRPPAGNDPTARWFDFTMTDAGAGKSATTCSLDLSKGLPELLAVLLQRPSSTNAQRSPTTSTLDLFKLLPELVMLPPQRPEFVLNLESFLLPVRCCWRSRSRSSLGATESPRLNCTSGSPRRRR
jgi:hypothetical protein